MKTTNFLTSGRIYNPKEISAVIEEISENAETIKTAKKIEYYNMPCAFDIETTSFYNGDEKRAIMYEWTLGVNGRVIIGRTWDELMTVFETIAENLSLNYERRIIIYVHNLGFEFQFLRKRMTWKNVFSISERKPIYAVSESGIEFRCSYLLSGYSLESLGEKLKKYPVKKMAGDLDYTLLRHSKTPLTPQELKYCENDVRVVMSYIAEEIENNGDITKIPLTKTGYVRTYCRNNCLYEGSHKKNTIKYLKYRKIMQSLQLEPDEYNQLKREFQGGFTHANAFYADKMLENVRSFDFTSSYPAVMVAEKFPMSRAEKIKITSKSDFERNLKLYCCLFDCEIYGLEAVKLFEHPLSSSRCTGCVKCMEDNGRIVQCEYLKTTLTEQDYYILRQFYKWEHITIGNFRRYKKGYLPTNFVKSILDLYVKKTELKGVSGKEDDYLRSKEMINSAYGMCVTDICRDEITYSDDWGTEKCDVDSAISKYNKSPKRFLSYAWGVWVTAYARRNLFSGILEFGNDYVYSDTDSVKVLNADIHMEYIKRYNDTITKKLKNACEWHKIDFNMTRPKTIDGVEKPLGVWDDEGIYSRFKTLGAKRYMTEKNRKISITVSGVNKKFAVPYLMERYGDEIFDNFRDGLYIPPDYTGKNTHTYIDYEQSGELTDYTGLTEKYSELSSIHLEKCDYSLSISKMYADYLMGVREYSK